MRFLIVRSYGSIKIPNNVTVIQASTFEDCFGLTKVELPENLLKIESKAFFRTNLSEIEFPDTLTSIGIQAFYGTELTSVYIPSSVEKILAYSPCYNSPFYGCPNMNIYCGVSSKPSGWGEYWYYRTETLLHTVKYGITREQYEAL